jgi:hypothetical protein
MSSKKKPRPLFEVPVDMESAGESGWVYRSAGRAERVETGSDASMIDSGTIALALGMTAIAQTMVLGLTIAAMPLTLSVRALRSFTGRE